MGNKNLRIIAIAETSADKAEQLKSICQNLIMPTKKEAGCISYELFQDSDNPGKFVFIESWKSQEHLDFHFKTQHLIDGIKAMEKIITKELVVMTLDNLA
jgi:quinol monooxygenase YgiN